MTVTLKFQSTGAVPGNGAPVTMRGPSLTIGRGDANDLVLPDPDRMVSKTHAVIENHNGNVVVVDLSTNGTFLNYGKIPLGQTPTPLNSGDVLTLGPYELVVEIAQPGQQIADPLADEGIGFGDASRAGDPHALLDAPGPGKDFLDDLLGVDTAPTGPRQFKTDEPDPFDQLLAPLGSDEDPFFGGAPEPPGPAARDDAAAGAEHFRPAQTRHEGLIPDEWDSLLDLGGPDEGPGPGPAPAAPPVAAPPAAAPSVAPPAALPPAADDDDPFGLGGPPVGQPPEHQPEQPAEAPSAPFADERPINPFVTDPGLTPPPQPASPPVPPVAAPPAPPPEAQAAPAAAPAPAATGSDAASTAFFAALGLEPSAIPQDRTAAMTRLGGVLNAMITGLREILMTRASIKGAFRIDQTMISAGGNNPLKFSVTSEQAIEAMVRDRARGYLDAAAATEEALRDIRAHEVAMVTGMEAALKGVLKKLDPQVLEEKLAKKGGGLFSSKKARYWELYEEMYAEISDQAENQFHDLFAREFAAAYKAQLERLK